MKRFIFFIIVTIIVFISSTGLSMNCVLDQRSLEKMDKETKILYNKSQEYLDKVNYPAALDTLFLASQKQPDLVDLSLMTGRFARFEARKHVGPEYTSILNRAKKVYEDVLKVSDLRETNRKEAEYALAKIEEDLKNQPVREAQLEQTAKETIEQEKALIEKLRALRAASDYTTYTLTTPTNTTPTVSSIPNSNTRPNNTSTRSNNTSGRSSNNSGMNRSNNSGTNRSGNTSPNNRSSRGSRTNG